MTVRDTIREALHDAVGWQQGLAAAWGKGTPERAEAIAQVKLYRAILKRRYGDGRLPMERALEGAKSVSIYDLRPSPKEPTDDR